MQREYSSINEIADLGLLKLEEKQLRGFRKLAVVGDLHGDYQSLLSVLKMADPEKDGIIFLGDFADRGMFGAKVIATVDALMKKHPRNLFCLKGNHEDYTKSGEPYWWPRTLREEEISEGKWASYFESELKPFLQSLYFAAIVPDQALLVHGGVSSKITGLNDLEHHTKDVKNAVLWSDPINENREYTDSRGRPKFGPHITKSVCEKLGVKRIIRSHQPDEVMRVGTPFYSHGERILTTSTTTVYGGEPFLLSINPTDFSLRCDKILPDGSCEDAKIVSYKS